MTRVPAWRRYLRFWRPDPAADVDDELRMHLDLRAAELRDRGLADAAARAQALAEFGDLEATRRQLVEIDRRMTRRRARFLWWDALRADLRYAARGLRASPLLTASVVLTLALGIGAAATMYGVMRQLLIQPPPHVVAPERVAKLYFEFQRDGDSVRTFGASSYPFYERLREQAGSVVDVAAYMPSVDVAVGRGAAARMASATLVAPGFWRTLGVVPTRGRLITDTEAHPVSGARVAVLGHVFWQRRFGGDPAVVGTLLEVKGQPYEIVGVAPRGFRGVELGDTDLWLPLLAYADGDRSRRDWHTFGGDVILGFAARLRPGVSADRAAAELTRLRRVFADEQERMFDERPRVPTRAAVRLGPLSGGLGSDARPIPEARVAVWLVGVAFVLLAIACANVAGLLLLRALRRRREIAVRLALGMSRRRLAALLFVESALLALLGVAAASLVGVWGGAWVRRVLLPGMSAEAAGTDWHVLLVSAGCTVGALLVTGLAPVLQLRGAGAAALRDGTQHASARRSRLHATLLAAQTAMSVVLLCGAGLFLRSLDRLAALDLGLEPEQVVTVQVAFAGTGRPGREVIAFYERALERVRAVPGVRQAAVAVDVPLRGARGSSIRLPGSSEWMRTEQGSQSVNYVGGDFFAATGMRIVQGRPITDADRTGPLVVVVNEALARRAWGARSPVGECVYTSSQRDVCATVVGVVRNSRSFRLQGDEQRLWFYKPLALDVVGDRVLLVHVPPGARGVEAAVRQAVQGLEPGLPYVDVRRLSDTLDPQMRPWRLGAAVFTAFGLLAALLAAVGLYGALAYAVTQRTREIGIRRAVGAGAPSLVWLVVRDGLGITAVGVAAGLLLALAAGPWIGGLLFEVSPRDGHVLAAVVGALLAVALLAISAPARRATKVDPMVALRVE